MKRLLILLLILISGALIAAEQVYKWVDENGVTHYSTVPPPDLECEEMQLERQPSPEEIAEAKRRQQAISESVAEWKHKREDERARLRDEAAESASSTQSASEACFRARWNLDKLGQERPLYYADDGLIYTGTTRTFLSLHDNWYTGPRDWIADEQRPVEIRHWSEQVARHCREGVDISEQCREMGRRFLCERLKMELDKMVGGLTGVPSSGERELREAIAEHCEPEN